MKKWGIWRLWRVMEVEFTENNYRNRQHGGLVERLGKSSKEIDHPSRIKKKTRWSWSPEMMFCWWCCIAALVYSHILTDTDWYLVFMDVYGDNYNYINYVILFLRGLPSNLYSGGQHFDWIISSGTPISSKLNMEGVDKRLNGFIGWYGGILAMNFGDQ